MGEAKRRKDNVCIGSDGKRYFHYTFVCRLKAISKSGILKREIGPDELWEQHRVELEKAGKTRESIDFVPLLWFSSNPMWDNTVVKRPDGLPGLHAQNDYEPVFRVEVNPSVVELFSWTHFAYNHKEEAVKLRKIAQKWNANPYEWAYSIQDIPFTEENFPTISMFDGKNWNGILFSKENIKNIIEAYDKRKR